MSCCWSFFMFLFSFLVHFTKNMSFSCIADLSPPFPNQGLYLPKSRRFASLFFLKNSVNVVREAVKGAWLTRPYLLLVTATRRVHGLDDIDGISNEERIECCSRHHTGYSDASLRNVLWWMPSVTNT